jgi:hypothetical protein
MVYSSKGTGKNGLFFYLSNLVDNYVHGDDDEKSEKIGPTFFWTDFHENFVPNFFGRKFGPAKFRKGSTPLGLTCKVGPNFCLFEAELFFRISRYYQTTRTMRS